MIMALFKTFNSEKYGTVEVVVRFNIGGDHKWSCNVKLTREEAVVVQDLCGYPVSGYGLYGFRNNRGGGSNWTCQSSCD